jgi:hypothetical protein
LNLFKEIISRLDGWEVSSMGGYYAYVEFPSRYTTQAEILGARGKVGSEDVARYLAQELGVVCLPGSFFMPEFDDVVWGKIGDAGGSELKTDKWLRYVSLSSPRQTQLMSDSQSLMWMTTWSDHSSHV